jgi:predicted dehydrogenase
LEEHLYFIIFIQMKIILLLALVCGALSGYGQDQKKPLRIGVAGLTHDHVHWLFGSMNRKEIEIVGIAEPDQALAARYVKQYNLNPALLYTSLEDMLLKTKPEAVTAFNSIAEHLGVVQACAPKKIHVMVEKPLAVSLDHARQMQALAQKHGIHLLTNYETTWYTSHHQAFTLIHKDKTIGALRKIVVHDGHRGPKEIGVSKEFLSWLTDPEKNGGGALMDFGCYGANLITWFMNGERPESVMAVTQQIKPDIYARVDDEATILVTYPRTQGIIQASWNWPYGRKDIEVYGRTGYIKADRSSLTFQQGDSTAVKQSADPPKAPWDNPFAYFASVVRGEIQVTNTDLSSLPLNITAMEILEAARQSAKEGKRIYLKKDSEK